MPFCTSTNKFDNDGFYQIDMDNASQKKPKNSNCLKGFGIAAVVVILAVGSLTAAYFLSHSFHAFANQTFTQIKQTSTKLLQSQMNIQNGLLYIAVPIVGAALLISVAAHIHKKHKELTKERNPFVPTSVHVKNILKASSPSARQMKICTAVFVILAALGVGGYFFFQHVSFAHQWLHTQALPQLQRKIYLWQGLAYIGGGAAALTLIPGLTILAIQKIKAARQQRLFEILNANLGMSN